jgi:amino-acid N-acetyltransferase
MNDIIVDAATSLDAAAILSLLERCGLPTTGLVDHLGETIVARRNGRIIGSAALELYADGALLRSVAVDPRERGAGFGHRLTEAAIARAEARGVAALYLLTTTAEQFFPRFGFAKIDRTDVPSTVRDSIEFTSACPASAIVMCKLLRTSTTQNSFRQAVDPPIG